MVKGGPILALVLVGCVSAPGGTPRSTALSFDMEPYRGFWETEVESLYPEAHVILVHGQTLGGQWYAFPSAGEPVLMEDLVRAYQAENPGRVVLVACNPGGIHPEGLSRVSYALENVWLIPDEEASPFGTFRDLQNPEIVGSIEEFTHR